MTGTIGFSIATLWLGYVYAGYPLLLWLIGRLRRIRPVVQDDFLPSVSVLIAARNEEQDIGWKVGETLDWDYPADRLDVLVASDASDDRTDEVLAEFRDSRLIVHRMEKRSGKNRALNHLVPNAQGELLFFTDANAHIEPDCLRRVIRHFADPRVGCVTGDSYSVREGGSSAISNGAGVYWGYESVIKRLEDRMGSVLVCDGAIFCIRRSLYQPLLPELANDLELPLRIGHAGYWILHEPQAQVLERDTASPKEEFARRRRICAQGALGMWKLRHTLRGVRAWQFVSHKFLRWLTLVPIVMLFIFTAMLASRPFFAALFGLQLLFWGFALTALILAWRGLGAPRLLAVPFYVVLNATGALAGVLDTCLGRQFDVWEIPTLSRGGRDETWQRV